MMDAYDVIIVGGRPAGSTLAARLGRQGLRVLMVERDTLPSLPAVSSPIIFSATMAMLDEIGADEAQYARGTPKIRRMVQVLSAENQFGIALPESHRRDYAYAVDRGRFDAALWENALRFPGVTGWQNFAVSDLLWEGDAVTGIIGRCTTVRDAPLQEIRARVVVGADGRFSTVARKAGAQVTDEHSDYPASIYYAYWQNVRPYDADGAASVGYAGAPGFAYLVMDSADNTAAVAVEGQSAQFESLPGQMESVYMDLLRRQPLVWERLQNAERITSVRGMRNVANLYRQPGGNGWALVGDAYHMKDPLDGQGIYNAVFMAKALAYAIRKWDSGELTWQEALAWYDETVRIRTYSMYRTVVNRVQMTLYAPQPPEWVLNTVSRWMFTDAATRDLLGRLITRQISPDLATLLTPPVMVTAMVRGGLRDLGERVRQTLGGRA